MHGENLKFSLQIFTVEII